MKANIVFWLYLQCLFDFCRLVYMRLHRFYVSQPLGEEVVIDDVSTIKQWLKVFRYTQGDFVILFNGDHNDYTYSLREASLQTCLLTLVQKTPLHVPARRSFLFLAVIKKDLFELVVEKATECGVTDIVPLITTHTEKKNLNTDRLQTIIKEASEQSGRGSLLLLHETCTLSEALDMTKALRIAPTNTFATTLFGKKIQSILKERLSLLEKMDTAFLVGPEGGWSHEEEHLFEKENLNRISLGETVLRAETAGIACALLTPLV